MAKKKTITKAQYLKVQKKHEPNKFTVWVYKNYSTLLSSKPIPYGSWFSLLCFVAATVGMIVFDQLDNKAMANKFVLGYLGFAAWFPLGIIAFKMNNSRQGKAAKELGVSLDEYNELAAKYD